MPTTEETLARLAEIPNLTVSAGTPLSRYTRFGIGGPRDAHAEQHNRRQQKTAASREGGGRGQIRRPGSHQDCGPERNQTFSVMRAALPVRLRR